MVLCLGIHSTSLRVPCSSGLRERVLKVKHSDACNYGSRICEDKTQHMRPHTTQEGTREHHLHRRLWGLRRHSVLSRV
jgi:hypothetical protein